ncbi:MAG TPA: MATE family efflux transporter, partial [Clostridiaceae bacterium]|nr:MATE family efflux transporter [Clostridiaceae bacterium]
MLSNLTSRLDEDGKKFYKILLTISIPIVIQNFLTSSVNMVDNLMIGRLGEESIAAVGVANQMFFLYSLICFGLNSGASIFYAQYYGSKDHGSLHRYMGMAMVLGLFASLAFSVLAIIFP